MAIDLDEAQSEKMARLKADLPYFSDKILRISTKSGDVVPLRFNRVQRHIHDRLQAQFDKTGRVRALILKGRKEGCSTYVQARFSHKLWRSKRALRAYILTHEQPATDNIFTIAKRFQDHTPEPLKHPIQRGNAKELLFADNDCGYQVATAGTRETGRSATFQLFHGSETAFWPNAEEISAGAIQAVGDADGTEIILESTANGVGNYFYRMYQAAMRGNSSFEAIFIPWYWAEDYVKECPKDFEPSKDWYEYARVHDLSWEQLYWAYSVNRDLASAISAPHDKPCWKFMQEYPACIAAGQRVGTRYGLKKVEDVKIGDITSSGYVSKTIDNGEAPVVRLTTAMGYGVVCTPDHRVQLASGDWVAASESMGETIRLQPPTLSEESTTVTWTPFPSVRTSLDVTDDVGRFLGYFMGDGSWGEGGTISIACCREDLDVVADASRILTAIIGEPTERIIGDKAGCIELRVGRKKFQEVLDALGVVRDTKPYRVVSVPECIFASPSSVVRNFLSALFESDGFAGWGTAKVSLFSKHPHFLKDVQLLLLAFGITSRFSYEVKHGSHGRDYHGGSLTLRAKETRLFIERIGFIGARKRERLLSYKPIAGRGRPAQDLLMQDEVTKIEEAGVARVYDLTIPGEHRFDASGIVVHNCSDEAFQSSGNSFIPATSVLRARRPEEVIIGTGPVILGVDPARSGDKVGLIDRCGRRMGERIAMRMDPGGSVTYVAAQVASIIDRIRPDTVNIDVGSNGAGVYDMLMDMGYGHILNAVNFGSNPISKGPTGEDVYFNRRAEMHDLMRQWFDGDMPVQIPDDDGLQADLTAAEWGNGKTRYNTSNELIIEEKAAIKSRIGASPDLGDAAALTFAIPYAVKLSQVQQAPVRRASSGRRRSRTGY